MTLNSTKPSISKTELSLSVFKRWDHLVKLYNFTNIIVWHPERQFRTALNSAFCFFIQWCRLFSFQFVFSYSFFESKYNRTQLQMEVAMINRYFYNNMKLQVKTEHSVQSIYLIISLIFTHMNVCFMPDRNP